MVVECILCCKSAVQSRKVCVYMCVYVYVRVYMRVCVCVCDMLGMFTCVCFTNTLIVYIVCEGQC